MSTIYFPATSEQIASLSASAAQFLMLVALGGRPPSPDAWGTDRAVRNWRREIAAAGIAHISWDRKGGRWLAQWTGGGEAAEAWVARHRATEAALEYPALGVDEYRFLRSQAPGLDDAAFDSRLTAAVLSARLAGIRPGSLLEWLSRGLASEAMASDTGGSGDADSDNPRAVWRTMVEQLKRGIK